MRTRLQQLLVCECGWTSSSGMPHYCHCGRCGLEVSGYNRKLKRPHQFVHGHDQVGKKHSYVKSGKDNPSYKGAACRTTRHYIKTLKPKPVLCDKCGILETKITTSKLPGRTKSKLQLCNISKKKDSKDPRDWQWLCHVCRFPRAANAGKLSDHLCECLRKCGRPTLFGSNGKVNRYIVGHNAAGQDLPANLKPGVPSDPKYRQRWHDWIKKRLPKPDKCPVCGRKLLPNKCKTVSKSGKYKRGVTDAAWTCRYGICGKKVEEGLVVTT